MKNILTDFMSQEIRFPDSLDVYRLGVISPYSTKSFHGRIMVVYCSPEECVPCYFSNFSRYDKIVSECKDNNVRFVPIVAPSEDSIVSLSFYLEAYEGETRIYLDREHEFEKLNLHLPKDPRFHCFLIDARGRPCFVGDPTKSEKLYELFLKVIRDDTGKEDT